MNEFDFTHIADGMGIGLDLDLSGLTEDKRKALMNSTRHDKTITPHQRSALLLTLETAPSIEMADQTQEAMKRMEFDTHVVSNIGRPPMDYDAEVGAETQEPRPNGEHCSECGDGYLEDSTIALREDMNGWMCDTCYNQVQEDNNIVDQAYDEENCDGCNNQNKFCVCEGA